MSGIELFRERKERARTWARGAAEKGATHALTLNLDAYALQHENAKDLIDGACRKLFREANRQVRRLSRRQAVREESLDFLGAYEMEDRRGLLYPHAHLAIALKPGEEVELGLFLYERWGFRESNDKRTYHPACRPLFSRSGSQPEHHLERIYDLQGWITYITKQTTESTDIILPAQFTSLTS